MLQGPGGKFPCVSTFLLETLSVQGERFLSPWMPVLSLPEKTSDHDCNYDPQEKKQQQQIEDSACVMNGRISRLLTNKVDILAVGSKD